MGDPIVVFSATDIAEALELLADNTPGYISQRELMAAYKLVLPASVGIDVIESCVAGLRNDLGLPAGKGNVLVTDFIAKMEQYKASHKNKFPGDPGIKAPAVKKRFPDETYRALGGLITIQVRISAAEIAQAIDWSCAANPGQISQYELRRLYAKILPPSAGIPVVDKCIEALRRDLGLPTDTNQIAMSTFESYLNAYKQRTGAFPGDIGLKALAIDDRYENYDRPCQP